jgi:hypothetical protein
MYLRLAGFKNKKRALHVSTPIGDRTGKSSDHLVSKRKRRPNRKTRRPHEIRRQRDTLEENLFDEDIGDKIIVAWSV